MAHRLARSSAQHDPVPSHVPRGDVQAFNRLVGQHQAAAYNLAYRVLGDAEAAAEVTQSAFVTLYRHWPPSSAAFQSSVLQHIVVACLRRLRATGPAAGSPRTAPSGEREPDVQAGIIALPPEQRIILVLADVCSLAYRDIAGITGLPVVTVSTYLSRARTALASYLYG